MKNEWFTSWFDTPYYHILYKDRNDIEAQLFIKNITEFLNIKASSSIADLPCGKGRHSVFLNSLGYNVTGGDLSENSINFAKQFENKNLSFEVWDMRKPLENKYDAVFNLFTSFLNVEKVRSNLVTSEVKTIDGIKFNIKREIKNGFILKHISFFADNKQHSFTEQVKFIDLSKFHFYFNAVGLKIIHTFGDYSLNEFDNKTSDRLILVAK